MLRCTQGKFAKTAGAAHIQAVAGFFQSGQFARLGATVSFTTAFADEFGPLPTVAATLMNRIADIAQWSEFDSIAIIFEASERADPLIRKAFAEVGFKEDGKPVPLACFFMPKRAAEPALEVADFIMHSIGRQARRKQKEPGYFVPDFKAVFHSVDRKLVSYIDIEVVADNKLTALDGDAQA